MLCGLLKREIWHHEGRVARHGASMMAPDYTHWHAGNLSEEERARREAAQKEFRSRYLDE